MFLFFNFVRQKDLIIRLSRQRKRGLLYMYLGVVIHETD